MNELIPLSNHDMKDLSNNSINIIPYPDLMNVKNIVDILDKPLVILYKFSENIGHWVLLFLRPDGSIEFFDSFGRIIDDVKKNSTMYEVYGQEDNYLEYLLYKSGCEIEYNPYKFQTQFKYGYPVATCGWHVLMRNKYRNLDIDEYKKFMDKLKRKYKCEDYDELVCNYYN